ncbi:unnamed protein product (macronuclear) [Paramecium tetraurelia]|uniref:Transmembrane protein n=1 Tax=Paramecium tetraurelia TaxID=5888 RepID=A0C0P4_PARTE|nr:uncharacterized protein GSPATT00033837001 [Paramecium tetraurelia]CAK64361.1 unnamed protein product [Paramecium tetraurelia]|eukprot:XP_001431759.1 hypothetical protein (macronuclear) [Paramecium tetraurelia strain d4-2]
MNSLTFKCWSISHSCDSMYLPFINAAQIWNGGGLCRKKKYSNKIILLMNSDLIIQYLQLDQQQLITTSTAFKIKNNFYPIILTVKLKQISIIKFIQQENSIFNLCHPQQSYTSFQLMIWDVLNMLFIMIFQPSRLLYYICQLLYSLIDKIIQYMAYLPVCNNLLYIISQILLFYQLSKCSISKISTKVPDPLPIHCIFYCNSSANLYNPDNNSVLDDQQIWISTILFGQRSEVKGKTFPYLLICMKYLQIFYNFICPIQ